MRTIRLLLEYDGTAFRGWQVQAGLPPRETVQGALQEALASMTGADIRVRGASRTDAGVHARGQVAAFDTDHDHIPLIGFERGLTHLTPPEIVVRRAEGVEPGWNPKRTSRGKRYRYTLWNDRSPSALDRDRAWWVRRALDLEAMRAGAAGLIGTHDFEAFRSTGCSAKHAMRTMYEITVSRGPSATIWIDVVGNAFVRNMVRIIVGNLVAVGEGKMTPEALARVLAGRDRTAGGVTAPAHGLCLEEVVYDERLPPRPEDDADLGV